MTSYNSMSTRNKKRVRMKIITRFFIARGIKLFFNLCFTYDPVFF